MIVHNDIKHIKQNTTKHGRYYDITTATGESFRRLSTTTRLDAMHNEHLIRWRMDRLANAHKVAAQNAYRVGGDLATYLIAYEQELAEEKDRIKNASNASTGELIHKHIEKALKGGDLIEYNGIMESDEVASAFDTWRKWAIEHRLQAMATEIVVFSPESAGTVDFIGHFDGLLYLIDWKTGSYYPEYRMQLAEYYRAYDYMRHAGFLKGAETLDGVACVQIPKHQPGNVVVHDQAFDQLERDLEVFDCVCSVDNWIRENAIQKPLSVAAY